MPGDPAGTCKSQDSDWPELTLYPHSCVKKHSKIQTCTYSVVVLKRQWTWFLSCCLSVSPSSHTHIYNAFACVFSVSFCIVCVCLFTEWVTAAVWGREQACLIAGSLHNGCPISWLLGLLIGAGRRESRGPIGVLGWTLWLEGMVCDAKRQCHMSHKYTGWQGHGSYCYYPSGLIDDQSDRTH